jgi:hypothetical protein
MLTQDGGKGNHIGREGAKKQKITQSLRNAEVRIGDSSWANAGAMPWRVRLRHLVQFGVIEPTQRPPITESFELATLHH